MLMKSEASDQLIFYLGEQVGLEPEIVERLTLNGRDNLEAYLANSADSTISSFRYDTRRWVAWALINDVDPLAPMAREVRDYAKDIDRGLKPSSVQRMISNVGVLTGKIAGNESHTRSMLVASELKRQRRKKGAGRKQALAIRQKGDVIHIDAAPEPFSITRMLEALEPDKSLAASRAKLLISLGGDTGRRGGEYRAAQMRDLVLLRNDSPGGMFMVHRSKTDQDGIGMAKFASGRTMRYFDEYRAALKECGGDISPDAPLFVAITRWARPGHLRSKQFTPLTAGGLNVVLREAVGRSLSVLADRGEIARDEVASIVRGVSSHSFRVGLAMDLVTAGESIAAICVEGGWRTPEMPVYYTRYLSARTGASARLAARLGYG